MPLPIEEVERRVREQLGLFAKGEQPQQPPSLFKQFVGEAMVPAGLAIRAGSSAPLPSRAPLSPAGAAPRLTPADYNAARAQLPPDASLAERTAMATQIRQQIAQQRPAGWYSMTPEQQRAHVAANSSQTDELYRQLTGRQPQVTQPREIPLSSPEFLRGLSPQQRQHIQSRMDAGYTQSEIRALADSFRARTAPTHETWVPGQGWVASAEAQAPQPLAASDLMRGLTAQQRQTVQGWIDRFPDLAGGDQLRDLINSLGYSRPQGAPQFDINRFRPPERGRNKPGMSAVQGEVSATYGEAGAPGPGYGELGNFMAPTIPGGFKPPALTDRLAQLPSPARRDLGYEMPIGEIHKSQRHGDWVIPYEPAGHRQGEIRANVDPGAGVMQISGSNLPRSAQGKGIGQEMYRRLIDEAHREGLQVRSDNILSPYSNRIYERVLTGQGYDVKRNPYAVNRGRGTYPHEVDEGGVYSVGPKEKLPAPRLLDMLLRVPKKSPYAIAPFAGVPLGMPQMEDD